jgi:hypothetical protein
MPTDVTLVGLPRDDRGLVRGVTGPVREEGPVRLVPDRELAGKSVFGEYQTMRPVLRVPHQARQAQPSDADNGSPAAGEQLPARHAMDIHFRTSTLMFTS